MNIRKPNLLLTVEDANLSAYYEEYFHLNYF